MGLHSTLFGPIKYAILPQALHPEELVGGNGAGRDRHVAGDPDRHDRRRRLMLIAGAGPTAARRSRCIGDRGRRLLVSRAIPPAPPTAPDLRFNWNPFTETCAHARLRAQEPRGVQLGARHLVVLVLRPRADRAAAELRQDQPRRHRARVDPAARRCSRSASASARCCARSCPAARSRSAWCRSARSASRCSCSTCISRGRGAAPLHGLDVAAFLQRPAAGASLLDLTC